MNDYKKMVLSHAAKGSKWKNHKYVAIVNGRYIYPGDKYYASKKDVSMENARAESQFHGYGAMTETRAKYRTLKSAKNYVAKQTDGTLKVMINDAKAEDKIANSKEYYRRKAKARLKRLKGTKAYKIDGYIQAGKRKAEAKKREKERKKREKELARQAKLAEKEAKKVYKDSYKENGIRYKLVKKKR